MMPRFYISSLRDVRALAAAEHFLLIPLLYALIFLPPFFPWPHVLQAEKCDQSAFRNRGITHMLLLGMYSKAKFPKTVQLRIATQDVDTFNMYTHLEKIHAFVDQGRSLGKILVVDATGKGESLFVFCATLMRVGFTFDDAERIMRRYASPRYLRVGARATAVVTPCCNDVESAAPFPCSLILCV